MTLPVVFIGSKENHVEHKKCHEYINIPIDHVCVVVIGLCLWVLQKEDERANYYTMADMKGVGKCPHDPRQNNTALLSGEL